MRLLACKALLLKFVFEMLGKVFSLVEPAV
jgi:hypothetical protein